MNNIPVTENSHCCSLSARSRLATRPLTRQHVCSAQQASAKVKAPAHNITRSYVTRSKQTQPRGVSGTKKRSCYLCKLKNRLFRQTISKQTKHSLGNLKGSPIVQV
ncbi:hypothetical protein V1264_024487 [Littorina saxatilis]|uniref:Uncharacterized protein n=1 Tax=Littorina saxatilis TaxID=31220 RepID=A0AAN9AMP5_9CAEN